MNEIILALFDSWSLSRVGAKAWPRAFDLPRPAQDLATVITGIRRCGKSTVLSQLSASWKIPAARCFSVNFEDPRIADRLDAPLLDEIVAVARRRQAKGKRYFFFDELQVVANWQKWLRTRLDRPADDFFIVTGSNAALLSGELATVLTGRHLSYELFPLSQPEFAQVFPKRSLEAYLQHGGFPRVLQEETPDHLLRQYYTDIIERDVRERLRARTSLDLTRTIKAVFEAVGSELSLRRLAGALSLSVDTVSAYLAAAENAYLCFGCEYFAYSERKRSHRNKKYYAVDTALRRAVVTPTGRDLGKDFENVVFLELRRRYKKVYYWKGVKEVDFVVETADGLKPFQVSWDGIKERHEQGLEEFYREFRSRLDPEYVTRDNFLIWARSAAH